MVQRGEGEDFIKKYKTNEKFGIKLSHFSFTNDHFLSQNKEVALKNKFVFRVLILFQTNQFEFMLKNFFLSHLHRVFANNNSH
jgi:hypothetical protein